ncbi:MAG: ketoacyl-ACP synthase III [Acholeplasmataceae bacterium]|nr:ketoacyl-ACP synthase III [Acholeplasmataceae bacterium]
MNQMFKIIGSGKYVPKTIITNEDLEKMVETTNDWIISRTGIKERRKAVNETCSDLAYYASKEAIKNANIQPDEIDLIVVATITGDQKTPSVANMVQGKLGITTSVMSFDINAACTGFVYGLEIASRMLDGKRFKKALVIGSEKLTEITDYTDRNTCVLFGDGAGAVVIDYDDTVKPSYFYNGAKPDTNDTLLVKKYIEMEGKKVYVFAVDIIQKSIIEVLKQANLTLNDIDNIIPHQANERIIQSVAKSLNIPMNKFSMNIESYGNTSAASIPLLLAEYIASGHKNETILLVGFGGGFTYGAAILYI